MVRGFYFVCFFKIKETGTSLETNRKCEDDDTSPIPGSEGPGIVTKENTKYKAHE
jgi:hypothetical protein